ncbi:cryptococcal mannosyltransferase 1-domain-containing protein [Aspergillus karnatakaensis]|uniref:glycosyltransferase family 69 protein n=1 Tax=Aspergillus karnatakaensis TaxID=1810916 RepID=UPI003CCCE926
MHVLDTCKSCAIGLLFLISTAARHASRHHKLRRRLLQLFLLTLFIWSTADVLLAYRRFNEEQVHIDYKPPERQRIYIASIQWDAKRVLSKHWNNAVVELADVVGPENVYVTVYESGGSTGTKEALRELDKALNEVGVRHSIIISDTTSEDATWMTPVGGKHTTYLTRLHNEALRPLYDLRDAGTFFDRILFLGDAVFTKDDVLSLLNTNYGAYTAACSFDILNPPSYLDVSALRDADGYEIIMQKWPFFRAAESRDALKSMLPVHVRSCWGQMVFMHTGAFYLTRPIRFREVAEGLAAKGLEASERCLIHADNSLSRRRGVYLNPFVRIGDNDREHAAAHSNIHWLSTWELFASIWENRLRRWSTPPFLQGWPLYFRLSAWEAENEKNKEPGDWCLTFGPQSTAT